jgi:RHS repeat-associated protein
MVIPGRQYVVNKYRFGYNGKENDNDVEGLGNQQNYGMRIYDPRLGRFLSVDPIGSKFPYYSPYHFAGNTPITAVDQDGREPEWYMLYGLYLETKLQLKKWSDDLAGGVQEYGAGKSNQYSDPHLPAPVNEMRNTYHELHGAAEIADNLVTKPGETALDGTTYVPVLNEATIPIAATWYGIKGDINSAVGPIMAMGLPFAAAILRKGAGEGLRYILKETDLDLRGTGVNFSDALQAAFNKTGFKKELFKITEWGKDKYGKEIPVEWNGPDGSEVSIDYAHDWSTKESGPDAPHIGWQVGKKNKTVGHIILDDVPASRPLKKKN